MKRKKKAKGPQVLHSTRSRATAHANQQSQLGVFCNYVFMYLCFHTTFDDVVAAVCILYSNAAKRIRLEA